MTISVVYIHSEVSPLAFNEALALRFYCRQKGIRVPSQEVLLQLIFQLPIDGCFRNSIDQILPAVLLFQAALDDLVCSDSRDHQAWHPCHKDDDGVNPARVQGCLRLGELVLQESRRTWPHSGGAESREAGGSGTWNANGADVFQQYRSSSFASTTVSRDAKAILCCYSL